MKNKKITKNQKKILEAIKRYGSRGANIKQISNYLNWKTQKVKMNIYSLIEKNFIKETGSLFDKNGKKILKVKEL